MFVLTAANPTLRRNSMLKGSGICKDCGNGTLNNEINEQFILEESDFNDEQFVVCKRCLSDHIDGTLSVD